MKLTPCANRGPECRMEHISKYTYMNAGHNNLNLKLAVAFLIGVIVGAFSFWIWTATQSAFSNKEQEQEIITNEITAGNQMGTVQDFNANKAQLYSDAIIVRNQSAGRMVVIEKAVFEEDGWVVIHEGTASHIGNALGATRFDSGVHSGVVELLRATEAGEMYRAVLYRDNGDREFNLDSDFPFLQNSNQPVLTTFTVE